MRIFSALIGMIRLQNALMASSAVLLGAWISGAFFPISKTLLLMLSSILSTGFGNCVNDIIDLESDKINHPNRPLPKGLVTKNEAIGITITLLILPLILSAFVSFTHIILTLIPLFLLFLYAQYLKQTPLFGNILVSVLVAYPLIYGSIFRAEISILLIPAILAFLLNLLREIIKDCEDKEGDLAQGIKTTAILPNIVINSIVTLVSLTYLGTVFLPYINGDFGKIYLLICLFGVVPVHFIWNSAFFFKYPNFSLRKISLFIKIEMLFGLTALLVDHLTKRVI